MKGGAYAQSTYVLRVSLLRILGSNFPGGPLYNYMDMVVPNP